MVHLCCLLTLMDGEPHSSRSVLRPKNRVISLQVMSASSTWCWWHTRGYQNHLRMTRLLGYHQPNQHNFLAGSSTDKSPQNLLKRFLPEIHRFGVKSVRSKVDCQTRSLFSEKWYWPFWNRETSGFHFNWIVLPKSKDKVHYNSNGYQNFEQFAIHTCAKLIINHQISVSLHSSKLGAWKFALQILPVLTHFARKLAPVIKWVTYMC